ncbi:uncharacterized protein LOC129950742 [Eupeodes corollae]|uniref:uncharacterized protein LOC129950742 n=1 Tax=Eupeodes corollae TaxID=290404 RepID=UPI0024934CA1|nr:uncharacterized protein LOC129950742 [Eupeodes corollae]
MNLFHKKVIFVIVVVVLLTSIQKSAGLNITLGSCVVQYWEECESEFVKFYVSTSDHPQYEPYLINSSRTLLPQWVNPGNQYKLVIHGYGGGLEYEQTKAIHLEYLKYNSTNVITVDWGTLAAVPCYPSAAVNTIQAGECIATFLMQLAADNSEFNPTELHIIGFSLGAHVAGFASNALERSTGKKVRRITGLDPALPFFGTSQNDLKLDRTDAEFVDVVHTNAGIYGKIESCGHVDFYMNGGQLQPACNDSKNIPLCSHTMAPVYFKESIKSPDVGGGGSGGGDDYDDGFWGVRCSSYFQYIFGWCGNSSNIINSDIALMGEHCSKESRACNIFVQFFTAFSHLTYGGPLKNGKESPPPEQTMSIGPCKWIISRQCPDNEVQFYLFTRKNMMDRQRIWIDTTLEKSNISDSFFNAAHPTKIIIHGYNSNMFLDMLFEMKDEYLQKGEYNIIYVDWSILCPGPCYISSAQNTKHSGACTAQLVERIMDLGSTDIHVIGFSLGAQVASYVARNLGSFLLPRITGLDPAMPLFITSSLDDKLDATDAEFVDVIHTNAFVQGKLERCGHLDFYMNGGVYQPGCTGNIFACSHQRAPAYFLESIRSTKGFWGWACSSYISYLLGFCPPTNYLVEAGENANPMSNGLYLITTANSTPFALGKWTDYPDKSNNAGYTISQKPSTRHSPLMKEVDEWGKLEGHFNNIEHFPTPYSQDPNGETWPYFGRSGTKEITKELKEPINDSSTVKSVTQYKGQTLGTRNRPPIFIESKTKATSQSKDDNSNWTSYRKNLTMGFIDKSIFQVPKLSSS